MVTTLYSYNKNLADIRPKSLSLSLSLSLSSHRMHLTNLSSTKIKLHLTRRHCGKPPSRSPDAS